MRYLTTLTYTTYGVTFDIYVTLGARRNTYQAKTAGGFVTIARKDCEGVDNTSKILQRVKDARKNP